MISNSHSLYFVPHAGSTIPLQEYQYAESGSKPYEGHLELDACTHRTNESVLECTSYSCDVRHVTSLPLSGVHHPGLIFVSNRFQNNQVRMANITSVPQVSDGFQPSFALTVHMLLMLI